MNARPSKGAAEGPLDVYLSSPRGFCAGVVRAVDIVEIALQRFGPPIYVKHQIVHNPHVVASLEAKGAVTVEDVDEIPEGAHVVFSAHGSAPDDFAKARRRGLRVIDATCPLVTRVHNEAKKYEREGKKLILIGHRGHQEVRGTMGQADMHLMDDRERDGLPGWQPETEIAVLTQTTLSVDDTARVVKEIRGRFPNAMVRNDICYATTNRQESAKLMARQVDVVLVIGAQNSSNCRRLQEVARAEGVTAYLINGPAELDPGWLSGVERVGITSGASTPEDMVQAVIEAINPDRVIPIGEQEEDIQFVLPRELRDHSPLPG
ncbi:MAG: 4-hydroxy-3-methylbut-2-enyl diphosphate reductase [SAR202 cluster bacterium]|nr:4-hydroxy-3-methylbut-2-enyl diphosphate reductase [SAR202 cluster bacterium]